MNVFWRLFLRTGVPFGLMMGGFSFMFSLTRPSIMDWGPIFAISIAVAAISGVLFGTLMALIMGWLHISSVRKLTDDRSQEAYDVVHRRVINVDIPYDRTFDLCKAALGVLSRASVREEDHQSGRIQAQTGVSWNSWGEIVTFQIKQLGATHTQVEVSSRPKLSLAIVDMGTNLSNVQRIIGFIENMANLLPLYPSTAAESVSRYL